MRINLSKEKLASIETAFHIMRESKVNSDEMDSPLEVIQSTLNSCFPDSTFVVKMCPSIAAAEMFVMSVYPEVSTAEKIIDAVLANKETKAIQKLWESNKKWTIEIDGNIINKDIIQFTDRELTSLLLHEIGHVVTSTSIPNRISLILRYEITRSSFNIKAMSKINPFKRIMSLPIFDSCIADNKKKSSVKEEIKADTFAKKYGYTKDLISAIDKLSDCRKYPMTSSINNKMKKVAAFSVQTLDDFRVRKDNLVKHNLFTLKEAASRSDFMSSYIDDIITTLFEDGENMYEGEKTDFFHERVDDIIKGEEMTEFFIFKGKTLKKIDKTELNYITTKINDMQTETDRMMIVSYINSKIDLVDYNISILENPHEAKKYKNVEYTLDQLYAIKKKLNEYQAIAMKHKLPFANQVSYVSWPSGPARTLYAPAVQYPDGYEG